MSNGYWIVHITTNVKIKCFDTFEEASRRAGEMGWCKVVKAAS